jgi:hypothetical protein
MSKLPCIWRENRERTGAFHGKYDDADIRYMDGRPKGAVFEAVQRLVANANASDKKARMPHGAAFKEKKTLQGERP